MHNGVYGSVPKCEQTAPSHTTAPIRQAQDKAKRVLYMSVYNPSHQSYFHPGTIS
jgi:hypothetical protein